MPETPDIEAWMVCSSYALGICTNIRIFNHSPKHYPDEYGLIMKPAAPSHYTRSENVGAKIITNTIGRAAYQNFTIVYPQTLFKF